MADQDAIQPVAVAKGVPTDRTGDVAVVPLGIAATSFLSLRAYFYNSKGDNSTVPTTIALYGGPNGTGQVYASPTSVGILSSPSAVLARSMSVAGNGTFQYPKDVYVNVSVASGSPGSTLDVALFGYVLP